MGFSFPYGVGMIEWEDFGTQFHNFLSLNEKMIMGGYLDSYPQNHNLVNYHFLLCSSHGG
jgi:hypothetical protein